MSIALRSASKVISAGKSLAPGMRAPLTSVGMTSFLRENASEISVRTKSRGLSSLRLPSTSFASSQSLPMMAINASHFAISSPITLANAAPGAMVSRSRKTFSGPKRSRKRSKIRPAMPSLSSRR